MILDNGRRRRDLYSGDSYTSRSSAPASGSLRELSDDASSVKKPLPWLLAGVGGLCVVGLVVLFKMDSNKRKRLRYYKYLTEKDNKPTYNDLVPITTQDIVDRELYKEGRQGPHTYHDF